MELKVRRSFIWVYVRRRWSENDFRWKVYQKVTTVSILRLAQLAERINELPK